MVQGQFMTTYQYGSFQYFSYIVAVSLLVEETTDLPYVTDKLLYSLRKILEIYTKQHTDQQYVSPQMAYQHKSDSLIYTIDRIMEYRS
jgi:hypothetical protein